MKCFKIIKLVFYLSPKTSKLCSTTYLVELAPVTTRNFAVFPVFLTVITVAPHAVLVMVWTPTEIGLLVRVAASVPEMAFFATFGQRKSTRVINSGCGWIEFEAKIGSSKLNF